MKKLLDPVILVGTYTLLYIVSLALVMYFVPGANWGLVALDVLFIPMVWFLFWQILKGPGVPLSMAILVVAVSLVYGVGSAVWHAVLALSPHPSRLESVTPAGFLLFVGVCYLLSRGSKERYDESPPAHP